MDAPRGLQSTLEAFFTAAINLILHGRRVYPAEAFEKRRIFDVPVHVSRHAELSEYIALSVRGAGELLARGELRALAVLVLGPAPGDGSPPPVLERFVFDLRTTPGASAESAALRAQLRGVLVKLNFSDSLLLPLPAEPLGFSVEVHAEGEAGGEATSEELREQWMECDVTEQEGGRPAAAQLVPFKTASAPELTLQLLVMEAPDKGAR